MREDLDEPEDLDEEDELDEEEAEDEDGEEPARVRSRSSSQDLPRWLRTGDGIAEMIVWAILAGGFFCQGYVEHPLFRGGAWIGCGLLGVWAGIGFAAKRWRGSHMRAARWLLAAMAFVVVWTGLQLVPLPSGLVAKWSPAWRQTRETMANAGPEFPARAPVAQSPAKGLRSWNQLVAAFLFLAGVLVLASRRTCAARLALAVALVSMTEGWWGVYEYLFREGRTLGAIYNPNHHAALVVMGLPLFFARLLQWKRFSPDMEGESLLSGSHPILLFMGLGFIGAVGWLAAFSRGSIVFGGGMIVIWIAVEAWGALRERAADQSEISLRSALLAAIGLAVLLAGMTTLALSASVMEGFSSRPLTNTLEGKLRTELWSATWKGLMETPWLGMGLAGTETALTRFTDLALYRTPIWSHNDYVQILAEIGLPAAIVALVLLIFTLSAVGRDWAERVQEYSWTQGLLQRSAAVGALICLGHAIVDFHLRIPLIGFSFLVLLALAVNWGAFLIPPRIYARPWNLWSANRRS